MWTFSRTFAISALDGVRRTAFDLLSDKDANLAGLAGIWPELAAVTAEVAEQIETEARYACYLERQDADIRAFRKDSALRLPEDLDYRAIPGLSNEARQVLSRARPETLGDAARLSGLTPAALVILLRYVRRTRGGSALGEGRCVA